MTPKQITGYAPHQIKQYGDDEIIVEESSAVFLLIQMRAVQSVILD